MQKDILDFLSEFAVFLQDHKFAVSESALAHLLRSVEAAGVDITEEDEMLAALSDRKSTRLNSSHNVASRMPSSA